MIRILCLLGFFYGVVLSADAAAGTWEPAGSMSETRQYPGLARLPDGRILAVTGHPLNGKSLASAEIYDPASNTWTPTGSLHVPRNGVEPGGLLMLRNGKVLISGSGSGRRSVHEAELFDPATGVWTGTGSMQEPRCVQTNTLLPDGRVLVTGGIAWGPETVSATAETYDYRTGVWTSAGTMSTPRTGHRAVLLDDGRVLVAGGATAEPSVGHVIASAEIFDPATGAWTTTEPMGAERRAFGMVVLRGANVLVVGGGSIDGKELGTAEIYDPVTGKWTLAAPLREARWGPTATLLRSGNVLVTGGMFAPAGRRRTAEIYDPSTGAWSDTGSMKQQRNGHRAIVLDDGSVLISGGFNGLRYLNTCEIFRE